MGVLLVAKSQAFHVTSGRKRDNGESREHSKPLYQISVKQKTVRILLNWGRTLSHQIEKKGMQINYLLSQVLDIEYSLYLSLKWHHSLMTLGPYFCHLGLDATKPFYGVSDKLRLKPVSSATETI